MGNKNLKFEEMFSSALFGDRQAKKINQFKK